MRNSKEAGVLIGIVVGGLPNLESPIHLALNRIHQAKSLDDRGPGLAEPLQAGRRLKGDGKVGITGFRIRQSVSEGKHPARSSRSSIGLIVEHTMAVVFLSPIVLA